MARLGSRRAAKHAPPRAHCHLGLGKLYHRTGDRAKAHEHLMTASAMYREMDMGFWRRRRRRRVPEVTYYMTRVSMVAFLTLALLVATLAAEAQQRGKVYRIALVHPVAAVADMTEAKDPYYKMLFSELRRLGYVEGQNLVVERRSGEGRRARFPEFAREVVQLQPDLIFLVSARMAREFQAGTTTIPIVGITADPIQEKLVKSLARPGGNLTGFSSVFQP